MNSTALALLLALFGVLLLALACRHLFKARFWTAGVSIVCGFALLVVAGLLFIVALNLRTYERLTYEAPVAELSFNQTGLHSYRVTLMRLPGGDLQVFTLNGDEWQLDARILKWQGWANLLGLNAQFRLERLSGRYHDVETERTAPRSLYGLSNNPGFDLWQWALGRSQKLPWVDAVYGNAVYLPMADGARYRVSIGQAGLIGRRVEK